MKKGRSFYIILLLLFTGSVALAQPLPLTDTDLAARYKFIHPVYNRIFNSNGLDDFYEKLFRLRQSGKGVVSIVHIGDSHVQGDFMTARVRQSFQQYFGNAGRGLVFTHRLAGSNPPDDILTSSPLRWQFNRIAHPELPLIPGISGFVIRSLASTASFSVSLKPVNGQPQTFTKLKVFVDDNRSNSWMLEPANGEPPYLLRREDADALPYIPVQLGAPSSEITLSSLPSASAKEFYGVSMENDSAGILVHTIGVNGARYDQYVQSTLFWQQLPALAADLYIISMGTNEAQRSVFKGAEFEQQVTAMIQRIKEISPNASILITTAPDSYKGKVANPILRQLNQALTAYCNSKQVALWDLYRVSGGSGSMLRWIQRGLVNRDRIHYTVEGYRLQGDLLWNALALGYNTWWEGKYQSQ
ncbi:hypothetical protein JMG10_06770 [Nostoc ellipsosporum NOK]|nr:hypothetical protein [Nostoc ellipsosporum NOK]